MSKTSADINAQETMMCLFPRIISRAFCETIRMTFGVCVCVYVCVCVSRAYHLVLLDGF